MKTQRGLIVRMAVPVLSLVTLGILSPAASSHGDLGLSSQPNALSAAFTRPVVDQKVAFTVHVRNAAGEPVSAAHVNVYIGSFFNRRPGNVIPRPAPYQKETDSKGIASFDIDVPAGATHLYISVEVSREDLSTERAETDLLTDPAIKRGEPIEIKLVPKDEKDAIYGGAEVVNVVFDVHDADDEANPIEGATVRVGGDMIHPPAVVTGADGKATVKVPILNATTSLNAFADKNGYKPLKDLSFKLSWGQRGKTVEGGILILKKIPGAATNIKVAIHVQDDKTNKGVSGAQVRLEGAQRYSGITDPDGNATLYVQEAANFTVTISQDFYEQGSGSIQVDSEKPNVAEFSLTLKEKKKRKPDLINVTVLKKDPIDGTTSPLAEAVVKDSTGSTLTDSNGQAVLQAEYDMQQDVTVTAPDYKSQTKSVRLNKYVPDASGTGSVTFTLDPLVNENTQLHLKVRVVDPKGSGISGALVEFFSAGRPLGDGATSADGSVDFNNKLASQTVSLSELRRGLTVNVSANGYKPIVNDAISADFLKPSVTISTYEVRLDKDWSDLTNAVAALEPRVAAWNADRIAWQSQGAGKDSFGARATAAQKRAEELYKEIDAAGAALGQVAPADCEVADLLKKDILHLKAQADQKAEDLRKTVDDASSTAAKCSTAADAEAIRSGYRKAIKLMADIGTLNKKAVDQRNSLSLLAQHTETIKKFVNETRNKIGEIKDQLDEAQKAGNDAAAYYARVAAAANTLLSRQATLNAEIAVLSVKYDSETSGMEITNELSNLKQRIDKMSSVVNARTTSSNLGYNPPVIPESVQTNVPEGVADTISAITSINAEASVLLQQYQAAVCNVDTMDSDVEAIGSEVTGAMIEVSAAADLPKQANDCSPGTSNADTTNSSGNGSASPVEEIPEDKAKPAIPAKPGNGPGKSSTANDPVETMPEDKVPGSKTSKSQGAVNNPSSPVDEIPEDKVKPAPRPPTKTPSTNMAGTPQDTQASSSSKTGSNRVSNTGANRPPNPNGGKDNAGTNTANVPNDTTSKPPAGGSDLSGRWVADSKIENCERVDGKLVPCPIHHLMILKRSGAHEFAGTWLMTGLPKEGENNPTGKGVKDVPLEVKVIDDGNGKAHMSQGGYNYQLTYNRNQIFYKNGNEAYTFSKK